MFIVAMTLAVLASVGVYALAAAATEVQDERQRAAEHADALPRRVRRPGRRARDDGQPRALHRGLMKSTTYQDTTACRSRACRRRRRPRRWRACGWDRRSSARAWTMPVVNQQYGGTSPAQPYTAKVAPGTFGSTPMNGDFFVELTEPMQLSAPGALLVEHGRLLRADHRDFDRPHAARLPRRGRTR